MEAALAQVQQTLYDAFGPEWSSTIYAPNNEYQVIMELEPEFENEPAALSMLYVYEPVERFLERRSAHRRAGRPAAGAALPRCRGRSTPDCGQR